MPARDICFSYRVSLRPLAGARERRVRFNSVASKRTGLWSNNFELARWCTVRLSQQMSGDVAARAGRQSSHRHSRYHPDAITDAFQEVKTAAAKRDVLGIGAHLAAQTSVADFLHRQFPIIVA